MGWPAVGNGEQVVIGCFWRKDEPKFSWSNSFAYDIKAPRKFQKSRSSENVTSMSGFAQDSQFSVLRSKKPLACGQGRVGRDLF